MEEACSHLRQRRRCVTRHLCHIHCPSIKINLIFSQQPYFLDFVQESRSQHGVLVVL